MSNCQVTFQGKTIPAGDFEYQLASNQIDLSPTSKSTLDEISILTLDLSTIPLLSPDKINSAQQEELINWLTGEVINSSLKNAVKDGNKKELLNNSFDSALELLKNGALQAEQKGILTIKDRIGDILDIYDKLKEVVQIRIDNFGIDFEADAVTPEDDTENYAEDKAQKINPYTKIGQEVKRQLFTIHDIKSLQEDGSYKGSDVKKTWFGFPAYKSINQVLPTILSHSKDLAAEFDIIKAQLLKSKDANMWFVPLLDKLSQADGQVRNQFSRWASKSQINLKYLQFDTKTNEFKFNNSNSGRQIDIITNKWKNNLVQTSLFVVNPTTNEYELDKTKAEAITENFKVFSEKYKMLKENYPDELFLELSNILKDIGVEITPKELKRMQKFLDTQGTKWGNTPRANFSQFFVADKGVVDFMIQKLSSPNKEASNSFDKYNPLSDNTGVRALTLLYSFYQDIATNDSYKNSNNDTIYAYSPKKYASDQFQRILNTTYLGKLMETQFASTSTWGKALMSADPDTRARFLEVFTIDYYDGAKGKGSGLNTPFENLSASEREKFLLVCFQNQGRTLDKAGKYRYGSTSYLTMSDKKTLISTQHILEDVDIDLETNGLGPKSIELLYGIFKAEQKRIKEFQALTPENKKSLPKEYVEGADKYILNPWVTQYEADGGNLNSPEKVKEAIADFYNKIIERKIATWREAGVVSTNDKGETTTLFDKKYFDAVKNSKVGSKSNIDAAIAYAAIDYEINTIIGNLNLFQLFAGDPASYWKKSVDDTLVNVGKRLAAQIAPGDSLANTRFTDVAGINGHNYTQVIANDHKMVSSSIKYLTKLLDGKEVTDKELEDFDKFSNLKTPEAKNFRDKIEEKYPKAYSYFNIEATDAQEYTTALEHAYNLYHEGKLSDKVYKDLVDKLLKDEKLSDDDVKVLMQPMKPVYFNGEVKSAGTGSLNYYDMSYIKTSSFPLLKQFTVGTELEKLRKQLEKLQDPTGSKDPSKIKLVRMVMSSGIKIGSVQNPVTVFNSDGTVNSDIDFTASTKSLTRDGYRIQLEVPLKDKNEVNRGTQEIKLLFTDLLEHTFANKKTGQQLKTEYLDLNKQLFKAQLEIFKHEINVNEKGEFDIKLLRDKLVQEAQARNFSLNEIEALRAVNEDTDGNFVIPLAFNSASAKFESLMISLVDNAVRKQKQTGYSSPLGSAAGFKYQNDLKDIDKSKIIWIEDFDPSKDLKQQEIINGKVRGSQVFVPWKFRDNKGKLLNIQDFIKELPDGRKVIDHAKLPKELLQSFGFRIPTQGLNSMAYLEIAGFLPEEAGDLLIAPPEFTKQMGSDFDIDKLYSYLYSTYLNKDGKLSKYKLSSETLEEFVESYKKQLEEEKAETKFTAAIFGETVHDLEQDLIKNNNYYLNLRRVKAIQNEILDMHFTVLSDPSTLVQSKIASALGFGKLGDLKTKYDKARTKLTNLSPLSSEYQAQKYLSARGGKAGTGYFSSLNVFVATMQGLGLKYNAPTPVGDGKFAMKEQNLVIHKKGNGLSTNVDNTGNLKSENAVAFQSAAVDDEKEQIMASLNITAETFYAIGAWILDGHSQEAIAGILTQPIIVEYINSINNKTDIFSGFTKNADKIAFEELVEKYSKMTGLSKDALNETDFENVTLSEDTLWDSFNTTKKDANWAMNQLAALHKFRQADGMGKSIQKTISAFNVDSKGLGKSFIEVGFKLDDIKDEKQSGKITNIEKLVDESIGGLAVQYSLETVNKLFSKFYPYLIPESYNKVTFDDYLQITFKENLTAEQKEKEFRDFYNHMKAGVYAHMLQQSGMDLYTRRKELMYGPNSLGKRIQELQRITKNPFLIKLTPYVSPIVGDPDTVSMRSIGGELFSEDDLYVGFLDLFNKPETRQLAKDLVDYFYINGGSQKAREFAKFIPTGFMTASGYADSLRSVNLFNFEPILGSPEQFLQNYIRNNPGKAPQLNTGDYKIDSSGRVTITSDQYTYIPANSESKVSIPLPYVTIADKKNGKVALRLYMYDGGTYVEIPRLGFTTSNYSGTEYGSRYSAIDSNSITQKVQDPNTLQEPVRQVASTTPTIPNTTKVVNNSFESLNLNKINGVEDIKITLSIINNSTSRALLDLLNKAGDLTLELTEGNSSYKAGRITIDSRIKDSSILQTKVLHEVTHAVTSEIINKILLDPSKPNFEGLSESQKLAYMRLNKTFNSLRQSVIDGRIPGLTKEGLAIFEAKLAALRAKQPGVDFTAEDAKYNAYTNLKEFLAEAFSDPTFQKQLDAMKFTEDKSMLQKFLEDIANFLNKFAASYNKDGVLAAVLYDGFTLAGGNEINIYFGRGENAILSNLDIRPFKGKDGREYASVEHAYQSWKSGAFDEATYRSPNWKFNGGTNYKVAGNKGTKTENNWNLDLMAGLIRQSFDQTPAAKQALLNTGDKILTHNQDTTIWKTAFPQILMELRDEYRKLQEQPTNIEREYTPEKLTKENMPANGIFVFGSNTEGKHGLGAAETAKKEFGAKQGQAEGLQGKSYAIITKDLAKGKRSIPLFGMEGKSIAESVRTFIEFANNNPDKKFYVTKIGSKLAGYTEAEIKSIFDSVNALYKDSVQNFIPDNVILPKEYEVRTNSSEATQVEELLPDNNEFTFNNGTVINTGKIVLNEQQSKALNDIAEFIDKKVTRENAKSDLDYTWTLQGYAGTGKTTITKFIVEYLNTKFKGYRAASPTHRAKEVLQDAIGEKAYTLASVLGLQPGVELENFNLDDKIFTQQNEDKVPSGGILIIDESSMVNDELYQFILSTAASKGTKVLFIGDDAQLKPVKQRTTAKPFRRTESISKLTKVMRTADGNPMPAEVLQKIRDNQNSTTDQFQHVTMLNSKGEGIVFLDSPLAFDEVIQREFTLEKLLKNRFAVRAVAYTNKRVRQLNDTIRANMFGFGADKFHVGEMVLMYENLYYNTGEKDYDYPNGSDNVIKQVTARSDKQIVNPATGRVYTVKGWELVCGRAKDDSARDNTLFVADMNIVDADYLKDLNELKSAAMKKGISKQERGVAWARYYQMASAYLLMDDVYMYNDKVYTTKESVSNQVKQDNPAFTSKQVDYQVSRLKMKDKSLDYSYAHTIHKSQGGTYDKVLVDENDINKARNFTDADHQMVNQLKYVAFSRSSKQTIVLSSVSQRPINIDDLFAIDDSEGMVSAEDLASAISFDDLSVSLPKDLGMDNLEFMKDLDKQERAAYRKLIKEDTFKIKCNG